MKSELTLKFFGVYNFPNAIRDFLIWQRLEHPIWTNHDEIMAISYFENKGLWLVYDK